MVSPFFSAPIKILNDYYTNGRKLRVTRNWSSYKEVSELCIPVTILFPFIKYISINLTKSSKDIAKEMLNLFLIIKWKINMSLINKTMIIFTIRAFSWYLFVLFTHQHNNHCVLKHINHVPPVLPFGLHQMFFGDLQCLQQKSLKISQYM